VQEVRDKKFEKNFQELIEAQWDYSHAEAIRQAAVLTKAALRKKSRAPIAA
jgi:hypothetical protein